MKHAEIGQRISAALELGALPGGSRVKAPRQLSSKLASLWRRLAQRTQCSIASSKSRHHSPWGCQGHSCCWLQRFGLGQQLLQSSLILVGNPSGPPETAKAAPTEQIVASMCCWLDATQHAKAGKATEFAHACCVLMHLQQISLPQNCMPTVLAQLCRASPHNDLHTIRQPSRCRFSANARLPASSPVLLPPDRTSCREP